jgi:hypothetical protein
MCPWTACENVNNDFFDIFSLFLVTTNGRDLPPMILRFLDFLALAIDGAVMMLIADGTVCSIDTESHFC